VSSIAAAVKRTYTYDIYGNATADGRGFNYAYDALNSLRAVSGTANTTYDYDGHQHLAKKVAADGTTHYLYGKSGRLFGEYVIGTTKSKEYCYLATSSSGSWRNSGCEALDSAKLSPQAPLAGAVWRRVTWRSGISLEVASQATKPGSTLR
jgi:YD repeat-containing protein